MPTVQEQLTKTKALPPPIRRGAQKVRCSFVLRCMIYPAGDRCIAECIDLDLAVRGKDAESAFVELNDAMMSYLKTVISGEEIKELEQKRSIKGLLPRKSPLAHRLRYHLYCLRAAASGPNRSFMLRDVPPPICHSYC